MATLPLAIEKLKSKKNPLDNVLAEQTAFDTPTRVLEEEFDDGSTDFTFEQEDDEFDEDIADDDTAFDVNLAEHLDDDVLVRIASDALEKFNNDEMSRKEYMQDIKGGLSLLGTRIEETNDPFPGACSAHHPLILESAVKFQAKASTELFNPKGPVKTQVLGASTPEKEAQAQRVRAHMNYQVMEQMKEYFDEQEQLLFYLPIIGSCFKKTYYSSALQRPVSAYVPIDDLVAPYTATNLESTHTFSHVMKVMYDDLRRSQVTGFYRDVELGGPVSFGDDGDITMAVDDLMGFSPSETDKVYTLIEQHTYLTLEGTKFEDEDGLALPYIVTFDKDTLTVLSIYRGWAEEDIDKKERLQVFTHYKFVPGMGFYGLGYIHLLGNLQLTLTSTMRSLIDSGMFANLNAGFVDKRLRIRDDGPLSPGQFKEVESGGLPMDQMIKLIPFKEPSVTLMQMYQFVEQRSQKFADTAEQMIADSTNYGPVGTTMALLEASSKFFSGVHKRLHKAQKEEFKILARINYEYLGEVEEFDVVGETFGIQKSDYDGRVDVVPQSDPNISSQAQRMTQAQAIYTAALQTPQIHDIRAVTKEYYESLGVDRQKIDIFVPDPEQAQQNDPITDIKLAQEGKPIKAFPGQDHDSHIAVKSAFLQDPQSGASPFMQALVPVLSANIQEHTVLKFQAAVAASGGQQGGDPAVAQAAQKLSQTNQELAKLQAEGVDGAKNKLANAEVIRATNEGRKLQLEAAEQHFQRMLDQAELALKQQAEQNKLAIAAMQLEAQQTQAQMKQMSDFIAKMIDENSKNLDRKHKVELEKAKPKPAPKAPPKK